MHDSEDYGYLIIDGKATSEKGIKRLLGVDQEAFNDIWTELKENGVIKYDDEKNAYFSKRLVKDASKFKKESNQFQKTCEMILSHLNKVAGKTFDVKNARYHKLISSKLTLGYKMDDIKAMIETKTEEWLGDQKLEVWLRPETLFGDKFETYISQSMKEVAQRKPAIQSNPYNDMLR
jgi:uncharacterized phage protein (TIGR02220 family)